jgi:GR25 family glycosyltransferase involved in LPS biosynthesis
MPINILDIPVFCINLDRRPDRWKKFSSQPGIQDIPNLQRFSGIDGSKIPITDNPQISLMSQYNILNKTRRSHDEIDTKGAVGATLSHTSIWKLFLERYPDKEYCLVFEDDTYIPERLDEYIEHCSKHLDELPNKFDIWLLMYVLMDNKLTPIAPHWEKPNNFHGFCAYIISRRGCERMLKDAFPIQMHIDRFANMKMNLGMCDIVIHKELRLTVLSSKSDIQIGGCRICNVPSDMNKENIRAVNVYYLYGVIGYAALMTGLYFSLKK